MSTVTVTMNVTDDNEDVTEVNTTVSATTWKGFGSTDHQRAAQVAAEWASWENEDSVVAVDWDKC
jgi:hypothetical protein